MKRGPGSKIQKAVLAGTGLFAAGLILLSGVVSVTEHPTPLGLQWASASTQYGILGQPAPEIELETWIDGNGKPMDPLKLEDYRGKIIYLYFFQDW